AEAAMAGQGRVLVRASGTEPLLRVMVEAAEADQVEHWTSLLAAEADRLLNAAA
ncbi:MAG: phosphoglucosamine mutase, partial [Cyanobacteriota bacterium]